MSPSVSPPTYVGPRHAEIAHLIRACRTEPNPLTSVCAWCQKVLREGVEPTSHTICPACKAAVLADAA